MTPATSRQSVQVDAVELFRLADVARQGGRNDDADAMLRALADDPDVEIRTEARFRLATALAARGRTREAAILLRRLLDDRPNAARVRIELARLLAALGDEGAARRELQQAQAEALPPDVALAVDQFANALRSRKPLGGSFEVALAPDTNINRATQAQVLDTVIAPLQLSEDGRARSGLGFRVAGQGYARLAIGDTLAWLPRVAAQAELYGDRRFNDHSLSVATGVEWRAGTRDRISPAISQGWRWFGGARYASTQTASVNWLHGAGPRAQVTASASAGRARYRRNPLQDGAILDVATSYERAIDARSGGSVSIGVTRQTARDPGYANVSAGPTLLLYREFGRATAFASVAVRRLEGDAPFFLFADCRREWLVRGLIGVTLRQFAVAGFAPVLRGTMERNRSSVGLYDYRRFAIDAGIVRAF